MGQKQSGQPHQGTQPSTNGSDHPFSRPSQQQQQLYPASPDPSLNRAYQPTSSVSKEPSAPDPDVQYQSASSYPSSKTPSAPVVQSVSGYQAKTPTAPPGLAPLPIDDFSVPPLSAPVPISLAPVPVRSSPTVNLASRIRTLVLDSTSSDTPKPYRNDALHVFPPEEPGIAPSVSKLAFLRSVVLVTSALVPFSDFSSVSARESLRHLERMSMPLGGVEDSDLDVEAIQTWFCRWILFGDVPVLMDGEDEVGDVGEPVGVLDEMESEARVVFFVCLAMRWLELAGKICQQVARRKKKQERQVLPSTGESNWAFDIAWNGQEGWETKTDQVRVVEEMNWPSLVWSWREKAFSLCESTGTIGLVTNQGDVLRAHLAILISRSTFFDRMVSFDGPEMLEFRNQGSIHMNMDTDTLVALLHFAYFGRVQLEAAEPSRFARVFNAVLEHGRMYHDDSLIVAMVNVALPAVISGWIPLSSLKDLFGVESQLDIASSIAFFVHQMISDTEKYPLPLLLDLIERTAVFVQSSLPNKDDFASYYSMLLLRRLSTMKDDFDQRSQREEAVMKKLIDCLGQIVRIPVGARSLDQLKPEKNHPVEFVVARRGSFRVAQFITPAKMPIELRTPMEGAAALVDRTHCGRILSWTSDGRGIVALNGCDKTYELHVDTVGLAILTIFNDDQAHTVSEMATSLGMAEWLVFDHVLDFIDPPHPECDSILLPADEGSDLTAASQLIVNEDFSCDSSRIDLTQPDEGWYQDALADPSLEEERRTARASDMRRVMIEILKREKSIRRSDLIVATQAALPFPASPGMLRRTVSALVDCEYCEWSGPGARLLRYLD